MAFCKKKLTLAIVCVALAAALLLPCLFANASTTDFSRKGQAVKTISAEQFLQDEFNLQLSNDEATYLKAHPEFVIKYSDNIPTSGILAEWDGKNDKITVTAQSYEYVSNDGVRVTWTPASVNGISFDEGKAIVSVGDEDYVTVSYTATITLDKDAVNGALNQYYNAAKAQSERLKAYEKAVADRNAYLQALDNYRNVLLPAYEQYLSVYAEWKRKDDAYNAYLADYNQYLAELEAYETYDPDKAQAQFEADMQRYQNYLAEMDRYNQLYHDYEEDLNSPEIAKYNAQLQILRYMYAQCEGRSLRNAIMGDTVTTVLGHKDELKILSGEGNAVDIADRATRNLRDLIGKYESCSTDEARYTFYLTCYEDLTKNFSELLRALDYFYRVDNIRSYIDGKGKTTAYRILLAQLYEMVNALDNGQVGNYEKTHKYGDPNAAYFDKNYRIGGQTPESILGDCVIVDSNDALPLNGVPQMPVPPTKPTELTMPTFPERPQKPLPPIVVAEAGPAPTVVEEPTEPTEVPEPAPYLPTDEEKALQRAFDNGLQPREEIIADYELHLNTQVKKYFRNNNVVTVFFHVSEDAEPYPVEGERGSYVEFPEELELPSKTKTGYNCVFDGWTYSDGTDVNWNNLRDGDEVHLYPKFEDVPLLYDVIWVVDGVEYVEKEPYDSYPQFDGTPTKADSDSGRKYRFVGWDKDIEKMTEDTVRYTAKFEAGVLITWNVEGKPTVTSVWKGDMPVCPFVPQKEPDSIYAYDFDDWNAPIVAAETDVTYTAVFGKKIILTVSGRPAQIQKGNDSYTAKFTSSKQDDVDISLLLKLAYDKNYGITLDCGDGATVLSFSAADVYAMQNAGVVYYTFYQAGTGNKEYVYRLKFSDEENSTQLCDCSVRVTVSGIFSTYNSKLFRTDGEEQIPTRMVVENNSAVFVAEPNSEYRVFTRYNVIISADSKGIISADATSNLFPNQEITLSVDVVPLGKNLLRIYAVDVYGNEVTLTDNSFVMPESDVTLFAVLEDVYYTVTFLSDGKTISSQTYKYGEQIKPPEAPFKAPDGENSYVFDGWDKPLATVTGDVVYTALYKVTPLEEIPSQMSTIFKLAIAAAVILGAAFISLAVALPIVLVRRKRRKLARAQLAQQQSQQSQQPSENSDKGEESSATETENDD